MIQSNVIQSEVTQIKVMQGKWDRFLRSFLSLLGIPLLGIGALIFCQGHPKLAFSSEALAPPTLMLVKPDPKLDPCRLACLRQQAKTVSRRRTAHRDGLAQAISGYNLIAQECTPAVFQASHLPPSMTQ